MKAELGFKKRSWKRQGKRSRFFHVGKRSEATAVRGKIERRVCVNARPNPAVWLHIPCLWIEPSGRPACSWQTPDPAVPSR